MKRILFLVFVYSVNLFAQQPKEWKSFGIGGGGAMFSPVISPNSDSDMYIACDMGDLFHSKNLGSTWNVIDFRQVFSSPLAKVCYTNNPMIVYTIGYISNNSYVLKSIDGGTNWNPVSGWNSSALYLFTDVKDSLRLIASDYNNIYFSKDGGKNFKKIYSFPNCFVAGAFFDGTNIYVASKSGVLYSKDNGSTFSNANIKGISDSNDILSFVGAKQNGFTRFYCIAADSNFAYPGVEFLDYSQFRGIYKLDWGNKSWVSSNMNLDKSSQFPLFCGMSLNDTGTVYVAGSTTYGNPLVLKSSNSAAWTNVMTVGIYQYDGITQNVYTAWTGFRGDNPWYSSAAIGFSVAPFNSSHIIMTGMGDAYQTYDGGKLWHQLYQDTADNNAPFAKTPQGKNYHSNGLQVTGCWCIEWSDSLNVFAGYTDIRGTRSTDGGESWNFNYTGHTENTMYAIVTNPVNGYMYAVTSGIHDMYKSTHLEDNSINGNQWESGKILYSSDKGATWNLVHDFGHPAVKLAYDPNNPKKMYASVVHHSSTTTEGGIYVCNDIVDSGNSWHMLPAPPRTEGHTWDLHVLKDGSVLCTFSGRRNSTKFTASSGIFLLAKGSSKWTDLSDPNMKYYTKDVVIDPYDTNQNTWYVCVNNGWSGTGNDMGGLYRTKNRGADWTRISPSSEPDVWHMNFESVTISPYDKNEMYLCAADNGLWHTSDLSKDTPTLNWVMEYPFCSPQHVYYNPYRKDEIWISGYGNSLRKGIMGTVTGVQFPELPENSISLNVFPNPSNGLVNISFVLPEPMHVSLEIYDATGRKITSLANGKFNGKQNISWNTNLVPDGIYFCKLSSGNLKQVAKIMVRK